MALEALEDLVDPVGRQDPIHLVHLFPPLLLSTETTINQSVSGIKKYYVITEGFIIQKQNWRLRLDALIMIFYRQVLESRLFLLDLQDRQVQVVPWALGVLCLLVLQTKRDSQHLRGASHKMSFSLVVYCRLRL